LPTVLTTAAAPAARPQPRAPQAIPHPLAEPALFTPEQAALMSAAKAGNITAMQLALGKGAVLNGGDKDGKTALMWAAYMGRDDAVRELLSAGADANAADKLLRMNYDIHTGAIIGLPGKVLAFCASLLCASLPITGFYIWWGRRKKDRREAKQPPRQVASRRIKTVNRSAFRSLKIRNPRPIATGFTKMLSSSIRSCSINSLTNVAPP